MRVRWSYRKDLLEERTTIRNHTNFENLLFDIVDRHDDLSINISHASNKERAIVL
jgi:hypothetical protein